MAPAHASQAQNPARESRANFSASCQLQRTPSPLEFRAESKAKPASIPSSLVAYFPGRNSSPRITGLASSFPSPQPSWFLTSIRLIYSLVGGFVAPKLLSCTWINGYIIRAPQEGRGWFFHWFLAEPLVLFFSSSYIFHLIFSC